MNTIGDLAARALSQAESLLAAWCPGVRQGGEWVALNPTRPDRSPGSFRINLQTGKWSDFATGDSGGNLFDLYCYLQGGLDARAALPEFQRAFGCVPQVRAAAAPVPAPTATGFGELVMPIPPDAPALPASRNVKQPSGQWLRFPLVASWAYRDAGGNVLLHIARIETQAGKELLPLTCWRTEAGALRWRWKSAPAPRPLYGLDRLAGSPAAQVVVVEGEKCAAALQDLIDAVPGASGALVAVTWPGGCKAVARADWSPLAGRRVAIWPDADPPGREAADSIAQRLRALSCDVRVLADQSERPIGWDVADAIADGWTLQDVLAWMRASSIAPPAGGVASGSPAALTTTTTADGPPFRCLGHLQGIYYYLPACTGEVTPIAADRHGKSSLRTLAQDQYWEREYNSGSGPGWDMAANAVMRACESVGVYDARRQRGRGAWWDNRRAVLHLGDRLLVDGSPVDITTISTRYIYERAPQLEFDGAAAIPKDQAIIFRQICESLFWERRQHALYLAGWCVLAPICGALSYRPHIWLTGAAGTGKTTIIEALVRPVVGDWALHVQSTTSAAGVRQELRLDALPVICDEFEGEDEHARTRVQGMLELARQAFTDSGARILKGTSGGRAQHYIVRSMFCFSSIGVNLVQHADIRRIAVVSLAEPRNTEKQSRSEHWAALTRRIESTLTRSYCAGLRARTIQLLPIIRQNSEIFANLLAERLGSRWAGDQVGPLLAGAWSLSSDRVIPAETAADWISRQDWDEQERIAGNRDEARLLDVILATKIRDDRNRERTIAEMVAAIVRPEFDAAAGILPAARSEGLPDPNVPEDGYLRRHGIRVVADDALMWIADSHPGLSRILQNTPWARGWGRILQRLPGAVQRNRMRFIGTPVSATGVPIGLVISD